ncbi:MAG TPA: hypothetical protein VE687_20425 [Stellaceae bacterium]|nr:hypothetical protein [Stellaceae bacterium]
MDLIRSAEQGGEAGQDGPGIGEHPAHHGNRVIGQQGVGVQHADDRCRGFLHATVDRRRPATGIVPDDKQPGRLRDRDGDVGTAAIHRQHLRRRRLERGERAQ